MFKQNRSTKIKKSGFTLAEILVVVAIIGILTVIAIYAGDAGKKLGRDNQRKTDIKTLQVKLEFYKDQYGLYPELLDGSVKSLTHPGTSGLDPAIMVSILKDPLPSQSYTYVPLEFSGTASCGASYYLYAILENGNNDSHPMITSMTACGGAALPSFPVTDSFYDVTSPNALKQN